MLERDIYILNGSDTFNGHRGMGSGGGGESVVSYLVICNTGMVSHIKLSFL